nr:hypothetical protein [Tanacetum cinerariifolium]
LVDAYEADKIILDSYGETVILKRRHDDDDDDEDEEPSAGSDRGSKRRREGQQYPHNLLQILPLILDNRGCRVIPFAHFINNDLEYLRGGAFSHKYTTSVTKTKAADYGQIKWIEDLVPRTMWIQEPIDHDKHALWGVSYWGRKRQQLRLQDIEDMLLLLVQGKLTNLTVEEHFAFNRRVEDLQLGVESYQKRLNLTKPDTY